MPSFASACLFVNGSIANEDHTYLHFNETTYECRLCRHPLHGQCTLILNFLLDTNQMSEVILSTMNIKADEFILYIFTHVASMEVRQIERRIASQIVHDLAMADL